MPINSNKLEALRQSINAAFAGVKVRRGVWPVRFTFLGFLVADDKLGHGKDKNELAFWLDDDMPIGELAYSWLHRKLKFNEARADELELLSTLPGFEDLDGVTDEFMALMGALPFRYAHTFKLPFGLLNDAGLFGVIDTGPKVKFVRANQAMQEDFPLTLGNVFDDRTWKGYSGLLDFSPRPTNLWEGDYVQIFDEGYAGPFASTNPPKRAIDKFKAVLGFALADDLLRPMRSYKATTSRINYTVHEQVAIEKWLPVARNQIEGAAASLIEDLTVNVGESTTFEPRTRDFTMNMRVVFHDDTANRRLITAAQWYFDAIAGQADNALLAFVQMMIGLEIIYGNEDPTDKIGLGELLRNRCAYAIGRTANDRTSIAEEFQKIYQVRSKIVHTGKHRLNGHERLLFDTLSDYCRRAIQNELMLLARDNAGPRKLLARLSSEGVSEGS